MTPASDRIRTVAADAKVRAGRLAKAKQFLQVADDARALADDSHEVADAAATLYVHAGIAASDAICAKALGKYARGENHREAIDLLKSVDKHAAKHLDTLLRMKTKAGYGHDAVSAQELKQATRAAEALCERAAL